MTPPRLLLLSPSHGYGGGIERVAEAIVAARGGGVTRLDLMVPPASLAPTLGAKLRFGARALRLALATRPDVILCLHAGLLPVARVAATVARARLALFAHGVEVWAPMPAWRRRLVQSCQVHLANSTFTAHWLAQRSGIALEEVRTVPLPVDGGLLRATRDVPPGEDRDPQLLTVSRLVREDRFKGHFTVAVAFAELLGEMPDARWRVVGDGNDRAALTRHCDALGIAHAVDFLPGIDDEALAAEYADAAVFILPSSADAEADPPVGEGFGIVYAEAGAFGMPIVAAMQGGGALDFVEDGATGVLVAHDDPHALCRAVIGLLAEPGRRRSLGAAARARTMERHTPERFAAALAEALG
jgi:phosphatidylinositol alpha-1,6-mannosyltransferase